MRSLRLRPVVAFITGLLLTAMAVPVARGALYHQWLAKAEAGDTESMVLVAGAYFLGDDYIGAPKNIAEGMKWTRRAADLGNKTAQASLGEMYFTARGPGYPAANHADAWKWFKLSAQQGEPTAVWNLGGFYERGELVKKDPAQAMKLYRQAFEADEKRAAYSLALMYAEGRGIPKDPLEAARWLAVPLQAKIPGAQETLKALQDANPTLVSKILAAANPEMQRLLAEAEKGDPSLQYQVARSYGWGHDGFPQDWNEWRRWTQKAAEGGLAIAQKEYASICDHREGAPDLAQGFLWYRKAAEQNDVEAQVAVGERYEEGTGTEKNFAEAATWYRRAVENKSVPAMVKLGDLYAAGKLSPESEAMTWFQRAAAADSGRAMLRIGQLYFAQKNYAEARMWLKKAEYKSESGASEAIAALDKAEAQLKAAQQAAAAKAAAEAKARADALAAEAKAKADAAAAAAKAAVDLAAAAELKATATPSPDIQQAIREFHAAFDNAESDLECMLAVKRLLDSGRAAMAAHKSAKRMATMWVLMPLLSRLEKRPAVAYFSYLQLLDSYDMDQYDHDAGLAVNKAVKEEADRIAKSKAAREKVTTEYGELFAHALLGNPSAEFAIGQIYASNEAMHDEFDAAKWIGRAARHGEPNAKKIVEARIVQPLAAGMRALKENQPLVALAKFRFAVDLGDVASNYWVGYVYALGRDYPEAVKYFRIGADAGDPPSMYGLGQYIARGQGVTADSAEGARWIRKSAETGYPEAQMALADCYVWGIGVEKKEAEAIEWFTKAAAKNFRAVRWIELLRHCPTPAERQMMAVAFADMALGDDSDLSSAMEWVRVAGRFGFPSAHEWVDAQGRLGVAFADEEARVAGYKAYQEKKFDEAMTQWRKAADAGNCGAMIGLATLYLDGQGVPRDVEKALEWYRKAAAAGYLWGRLELRRVEAELLVVEGEEAYDEKKKDVARVKFEQAAAQGCAAALYNLGVLHENGDTVKADLPRALQLYYQALALQHEKAPEAIDRVRKKLGLDDSVKSDATAKPAAKP